MIQVQDTQYTSTEYSLYRYWIYTHCKDESPGTPPRVYWIPTIQVLTTSLVPLLMCTGYLLYKYWLQPWYPSSCVLDTYYTSTDYSSGTLPHVYWILTIQVLPKALVPLLMCTGYLLYKYWLKPWYPSSCVLDTYYTSTDYTRDRNNQSPGRPWRLENHKGH